VSNIFVLITIDKVVFYCNGDLPTLGKIYLQSAENPNNEQRAQVFRYSKVSTLHENLHTGSARRSPFDVLLVLLANAECLRKVCKTD